MPSRFQLRGKRPHGTAGAREVSDSSPTFQSTVRLQKSNQSSSPSVSSEGEDRCLGLGSHMKRLSNRSLNSGLGPILTVAADADEVIYGARDPVPGVSPLSEGAPTTDIMGRSISALAGRISRQTMNTSFGKRSISGTPQSLEMITPRITPIRSMQPSRNSSTEFEPCPSSAAHEYSIAEHTTQAPASGASSKYQAQESSLRIMSSVDQLTYASAPVSPDSGNKQGAGGQDGKKPSQDNVSDGATANCTTCTNACICFKSPPGDSFSSPTPVNLEQITIRRSKTTGLRKRPEVLARESLRTGNPSGENAEVAINDTQCRLDSTALDSFQGPSNTNKTALPDVPSPTAPPHRATDRWNLLSRLSDIPDAASDRVQPVVEGDHMPCVSTKTEKDIKESDSRPNTAVSTTQSTKSKDVEEGTKSKAKRSFRSMFTRKDCPKAVAATTATTEATKPSKPCEGKKSSIKSSLAKRFRHSGGSPATAASDQIEMQSEPREDNGPATTPAHSDLDHIAGQFPALPPLVKSQASPAMRPQTPGIVNHLLDQVYTLPAGSHDRRRGLQVVQVRRLDSRKNAYMN